MGHGESYLIHGMENSILGLYNLDWNVFFWRHDHYMCT